MVNKFTLSLERVRKALDVCHNPVIMFSGGKDSTCILHLVRSVNPDIPALFENTGVEAKETMDYIKNIDNILITKSDHTFWQIVDRYGYPGIKSSQRSHDGNKCCVYLKHKPGQKMMRQKGFDLAFFGLTMSESRNRMMLLKRKGSLYYAKSDKIWKCNPIMDWTESDVWTYIKYNKIPYNSGYDKGWLRCGCVPCTAYLSWQERLANDNPKMLRYLLKKRYGQRQCGDFI